MLDVAILEGARTPFVKAFGALAAVPAQELGRIAAVGALQRAALSPGAIDQTVFGNVAVPPEAPNPARVIALNAGIPQDRPAHTVQRNCASGFEAITTAAQLIHMGDARTVLAGGTESMSQIPFLFSREAGLRFMDLARARSWTQRLRGLAHLRPRHFRPIHAARIGLRDPVVGLLMGETAEVLADEFGISRQEQDSFALESHRRACAAQARCVFSQEIVPVADENLAHPLEKDIGPRKDQTLEALARLPAFFKTGGTVTVGNSCGITDGAAAVIAMSGEAARSEGRTPLGYVRAYAYAGCDPKRMGLGPVFATRRLLDRTGMKVPNIELVELNEAFAAQVIANEKAFASDRFARDQLGLTHALGELDRSRMNVNGGAIALGHPVGATGARLVLTLLQELRRRGLRWGLACMCIGGGQGGAVLVERA